jgi:hypothetical protein
LANLGQSGQTLGLSDLPLSKSGARFMPPVPPATPEQALTVAHWLSPNLVDYFTKTPPPAPPFPAIPGKIPSTDNPYAAGAALEAVDWLLTVLSGGETAAPRALAQIAEEAAPNTIAKLAAAAAAQGAKSAADAPALSRAAERIIAVPYGELRGTLPPGYQANHLNQYTVYKGVIEKDDGLSVPMRGNILTEPGTPHHNYHRSLEQFWDQYREGGSLASKKPTNAQYGEAVRRALIDSGFSPAQASDLAAQAADQRFAKGLIESAEVPYVPKAIWRNRRK